MATPRPILIVEDDAALRATLAEQIAQEGDFTADEAESATEAAAKLADGDVRYDAILLDIGLPDGDGFQLAERLRSLPWPVRVVLISADADRTNRPAARRAGASGFVTKEELSGAELRRLMEDG